MIFYVVPRIGDGSSENPYRPDLPEGTSFVGAWHGQNGYLVAVPAEIAGRTALSEAERQTECAARGIAAEDVLTWSVGAPDPQPQV